MLQPGQLNRELGVCYALEGSVRRNGNQVPASRRSWSMR